MSGRSKNRGRTGVRSKKVRSNPLYIQQFLGVKHSIGFFLFCEGVSEEGGVEMEVRTQFLKCLFVLDEQTFRRRLLFRGVG